MVHHLFQAIETNPTGSQSKESSRSKGYTGDV